MQAVIIQRRIESLPTLSGSGKRVNGLHRLMRSSYLFERAYEKVSLNKGALTPGVDGKTFDGMSLTKLADIGKRARAAASASPGTGRALDCRCRAANN